MNSNPISRSVRARGAEYVAPYPRVRDKLFLRQNFLLQNSSNFLGRYSFISAKTVQLSPSEGYIPYTYGYPHSYMQTFGLC